IASLEKRDPKNWPAVMYLDSADKYRGWFQSSLLTAIAVKGKAPYKTVLTHGWTVDGEGKAMHKSLGNAVAPEHIIKQYGADLLRLWAASSDYRMDVRASDKIFRQLSDIYLKIRNTARYILGNLNGFDPDHPTPFAQMDELDQWAVTRFNQLVKKVRDGYETYAFHIISHSIHNFCVIDMSNFYLDVLKDRLYCEAPDSPARRSAQSAMYLILDGMVRMLCPILAFTSEEIWRFMPHHKEANPESVLLNPMPEVNPSYAFPADQAERWELLLNLRADVNKALELSRAEKVVGKSLDAAVTLYLDETGAKALASIQFYPLKTLLIVSQVEVVNGTGAGYKGAFFPGLTVGVSPSAAPKCARCWCHDESVGTDEEHPHLCPRCASVVKSL
ncbi:MAG: class I tRNA ligase family protein, partial [Oscillospiraceae bacterium]|nr:class I tRNA ligase family protein [Oscillospiraceae bacterium]